MMNSQELKRYSQHLKLKEIGIEGQEKLKSARVLCVGAGGLGSPLLLYLAAAGVGTIGIIDDDRIELSNLQRQILYDVHQLGSLKAEVASEKLKALNPDIELNIYTDRFTLENGSELIQQYDIVADCSDNFTTRYLINDLCFNLKKPFVSASISQFKGQLAFYSGQEGPCYRCLFPAPPESHLISSCEEEGVLGVLPGLLGTLQATEVLKYFLGIGDLLVGRFLVIDALEFSFREFQFSQNTDCEICSQEKSAEELFKQYFCCSEQELKPKMISVQELKAWLDRSSDCVLLDVRTLEEHQEFNLGGTWIPLKELPNRLKELDSNQTIVVYCRLGNRSLKAAQILMKAHFTSVQMLEGGVEAWKNGG